MILRFVYFVYFIAAALTVCSFSLSYKKQSAGKPAFKQASVKWVPDKAHSAIKFKVDYMVFTETEGTFSIYDGSMENTRPDFSDARITFSVNVNSINTGNDRRDKHLKSDDFFNTAKFPLMKFTSTAFTPAGGDKYTLTGNLTIRDIVKPVTFNVTYGGNVKGDRAGFIATTTINRFDYGLKWDKATETGGLVVSREVVVTVNIEWKKAG